ncbi:endophilin-B2 isoform X7 [Varanus komodoensis]|nr:endophilin-B2 isoform X7 [Varanus komodoensis]
MKTRRNSHRSIPGNGWAQSRGWIQVYAGPAALTEAHPAPLKAPHQETVTGGSGGGSFPGRRQLLNPTLRVQGRGSWWGRGLGPGAPRPSPALLWRFGGSVQEGEAQAPSSACGPPAARLLPSRVLRSTKDMANGLPAGRSASPAPPALGLQRAACAAVGERLFPKRLRHGSGLGSERCLPHCRFVSARPLPRWRPRLAARGTWPASLGSAGPPPCAWLEGAGGGGWTPQPGPRPPGGLGGLARSPSWPPPPFLSSPASRLSVCCLHLPQAEHELRLAQTEFDRQAEVTRLLLEGISSTHINHLRCLHEFAEAQAAYYAQCHQYMLDLQKQLGR